MLSVRNGSIALSRRRCLSCPSVGAAGGPRGAQAPRRRPHAPPARRGDGRRRRDPADRQRPVLLARADHDDITPGDASALEFTALLPTPEAPGGTGPTSRCPGPGFGHRSAPGSLQVRRRGAFVLSSFGPRDPGVVVRTPGPALQQRAEAIDGLATHACHRQVDRAPGAGAVVEGQLSGEDTTVGSRSGRREPMLGPSRRLTAGMPPATGAAVMSTGILSTATQLVGLRLLSWVLFVLAVLAELALGAVLVSRLLTDRPGWLSEAATPASLTGVAATAVIGGRIASLGAPRIAWVLLGASVLLWLVLLPLVLRHWQVPTIGASFLICVATEGVALLAATQGAVTGSRPAAAAGFGAFLLGLILYAVVLARFDWRQLIVGAGDQWVVAGALAISSLAGAELVLAGDRLGPLGGGREPGAPRGQ